MKKQIQSFGCAFRGIWYTVKNESHMRFHMAAAFYVLLFSLFYEFSPVQTAILVILIALVMAAEVFNTCIEELCNLVADRYEPLVKTAKDTAAGAVLVLSIASAVTAVLFFLDFDVLYGIFLFFCSNPVLLVPLAVSAVFSVIFVRLGPVGIREKLIRLKVKK